MFKKVLLALGLVTLSLPTGLAQIENAQIKNAKVDRPAGATIPVSQNPLVVGERLNYDVSWSNFIVAGELTLETKDRRIFDGVDGYHVSAQAQSVGVVHAFVYKVNDVYESFINATTLQPFRAEKRSRRDKKRQELSVTIDQKQRTARLSDGRSVEIPADTYDFASLIYAIRAMDLTPGRARTLHLLEDNKVYTLRVEPERREKVTLRSGNYDTIKVTTKLVSGGEAKNLYDLSIYVTTDSRRLPVLITAEPAWGEVRVELTSATGTKKK